MCVVPEQRVYRQTEIHVLFQQAGNLRDCDPGSDSDDGCCTAQPPQHHHQMHGNNNKKQLKENNANNTGVSTQNSSIHDASKQNPLMNLWSSFRKSQIHADNVDHERSTKEKTGPSDEVNLSIANAGCDSQVEDHDSEKPTPNKEKPQRPRANSACNTAENGASQQKPRPTGEGPLKVEPVVESPIGEEPPEGALIAEAGKHQLPDKLRH